MKCKLLHRKSYHVIHDINYNVDMEVEVSSQAQKKELTEVDDTISDHLKSSTGLEELADKCFKSFESSKQASSNPYDTIDAFLTNWLDLEIDYNKFLHEDAPEFSTSEFETIKIFWLINCFDLMKFLMEGHKVSDPLPYLQGPLVEGF